MSAHGRREEMSHVAPFLCVSAWLNAGNVVNSSAFVCFCMVEGRTCRKIAALVCFFMVSPGLGLVMAWGWFGNGLGMVWAWFGNGLGMVWG